MKSKIRNSIALAKKKKSLLIGLGLAVAGTVSYFGWWYWKKRKSQIQDAATPNIPPDTQILKWGSKPIKPKANDQFPLRKGSTGNRVKLLQQALIEKHGKAILPKYGADGGFGIELVTALKKLGLPEQINENTFNVIANASAIDPKKVSMELYKAVASKDFSKTLGVLKTFKSVKDYKAVSEHFLNYRIGGNVRQTIVTGVMNMFPQPNQKDQLRMEFLRMGLSFDGNKWSLSGIDMRQIITTVATLIWKDKKTSIPVPANMVLGREVARKSGYVMFENGGRNFLVSASMVTLF